MKPPLSTAGSHEEDMVRNKDAFTTGRLPSVSGGRCSLKSEQQSFVIYRRNTYEQYGGYNLFQNAEFKADFNKRLKKMLTEPCVMFF